LATAAVLREFDPGRFPFGEFEHAVAVGIMLLEDLPFRLHARASHSRRASEARTATKALWWTSGGWSLLGEEGGADGQRREKRRQEMKVRFHEMTGFDPAFPNDLTSRL
jgi:hypothetical protein